MKTTLTTLLALALTTPLLAAESPLVTLTPLQVERAGISTLRPRVAGGNAENPQAGTQSRLSGMVIVPNSGLNLATAPLPGILQKLLVDPLQTVRAGQALAEIYSADYLTLQQGYLEALSAAQVADARATRDESLFKDGIIAASRLEETRSQKLMADALFEEHRQSLVIAGLSATALAKLKTAADLSPVLTVTARMAGSILEQLATPGQRLEAGAPLFRIAESSKLWLELHATAAESALIRPGDAVTVPGCDKPGRIVSASTHLSNANQSVTLRAEFSSPGSCLKPNQFVTASVASGALAAGTLGIPSSAIIRSLGQDYVFVREGAGFRASPVTIVARGGDLVWAKADFPATAEIVTQGVTTLRGAWIGLGPETAGQP
jgi:cobalt-zinc-cadmium efflux system membrane fusion protein